MCFSANLTDYVGCCLFCTTCDNLLWHLSFSPKCRLEYQLKEIPSKYLCHCGKKVGHGNITCVYVCLCACGCVCVCMRMYVCVCMHAYVCVYACVYVCVCECACRRICVCMRVCMPVWVSGSHSFPQCHSLGAVHCLEIDFLRLAIAKLNR